MTKAEKSAVANANKAIAKTREAINAQNWGAAIAQLEKLQTIAQNLFDESITWNGMAFLDITQKATNMIAYIEGIETAEPEKEKMFSTLEKCETLLTKGV